MRLYPLAFACRLYSTFEEFDSATRILRESTGLTLVPSNRVHGHALMVWLNKWGCRQFMTEYHESAVEELNQWADAYLGSLPANDSALIDLPDSTLAAAASAYDDLQTRIAGRKKARGSSIEVRFGPTGAAKILYALRPNCFPPWDAPIRARFDWDGSRASWLRFLSKVKSEIEELASDAQHLGIMANDIPRIVGRPDRSLPKLVDEYYWVTITKGFHIPSQTELARWSEWCTSGTLSN